MYNRKKSCRGYVDESVSVISQIRVGLCLSVPEGTRGTTWSSTKNQKTHLEVVNRDFLRLLFLRYFLRGKRNYRARGKYIDEGRFLWRVTAIVSVKNSFEWIPLRRNSILRGTKILLEVVFLVASADLNCQLHSWPPIISEHSIPRRIQRGIQWWHLKIPRLWFRGRTGRSKSKIPLEVVFFAVPFLTDVFTLAKRWQKLLSSKKCCEGGMIQGKTFVLLLRIYLDESVSMTIPPICSYFYTNSSIPEKSKTVVSVLQLQLSTPSTRQLQLSW